MKKIVMLIFLALTLAACATLPEYSSQNGLLVIPVKTYSKDKGSYYIYYRVYYKMLDDSNENEETYILISDEKKMVIVKDLTPGNYELYAIEQVYKGRNEVFNRVRKSAVFTIDAGKITILDKELEISFREAKDGVFKQHVELINIDDKSKEKAKSLLREDKNYKYWEIKEET